MKKLDKRGFTIPEVLIAFLLISMIIVWVTASLPGIKNMSNNENHRLLALMRNVDVLESTRYEIVKNGRIKRLSNSELSGDKYGKGIYYVTTYERFESSKDINSRLNEILRETLDTTKYPELAELVPREGSKSELYLISVNTTVARKRLPNTELTSFIYRGEQND